MSSVDEKFRLWQQRLLDLSKRNRLLYFREFKRTSVKIVEPPPDSIFHTLVIDEKKLTFVQRDPGVYSYAPDTHNGETPAPAASATNGSPVPASPSGSMADGDGGSTAPPVEPPASLSPNGPVNPSPADDLRTPEARGSAPSTASSPRPLPPLRAGEIRAAMSGQALENTLYAMRSKARSAFEEQGANILFLAFGMCKWYESPASSELVRSPVLLVPVELDRASVSRPYTVEMSDEDIILNPTLAYKFQTDFRLTLPTAPDDWSDVALSSFLDRMREVLRDQPRWSVDPDVYLGLFSFEKLVILKDLAAHATRTQEHPLIRALAGDPSAVPPAPADAPNADTLDQAITPQETYQVLDADSSQQEAILRAKRGQSLIIQGPPGTGKSQTIANLISEFLAQDKRILFVSQKEAALDVVYQRLEETGLSEFCLKAHGHKASKSELLKQLERALDHHEGASAAGEADLALVADVRKRLDDYVIALHTETTALRETPFHVHGLLANRESAPLLSFSHPAITEVDPARFGEMQNAVEALAASAAVWHDYSAHPWRDTPLTQFSFQLRSDVETKLKKGIEALDRMMAAAAPLATQFGLPCPANLEELLAFERIAAYALSSPLPPPEWLGPTDLNRVRDALAQAHETQSYYRNQREILRQFVTPALLEFPDLAELRQRFDLRYTSWTRMFDANYRLDLARIRATAQTGAHIGYPEACRILRTAEYLKATERWFADQAPAHRQLFGRFAAGVESDYETATAALDWAETCRRYNPGLLPSEFIDIVCNHPERIKGSGPALTDLGRERANLQARLAELAAIVPPQALKEATPLPALKQNLQALFAELDRLEEWLAFATVRARLRNLALDSFVETVIAEKPPSEQLQAAFLRRFYHLWLDAVYAQNPVLRTNGEEQARAIDKFRALDRRQIALARTRVQQILRDRRPNPALTSARSSEVAILKRELQRRRHRSIRKLFGEIPHLLLALTPCLMMSPLSVSMFLSGGDFEFDVVLFDEASQIVPEDAIASILRARQMVVAGDSRQLPPTSFFKSLGLDAEEAGDDATDEVLESILQEASAFLPDAYLRWHYRSRHESLIAFSNANFYDSRLVTFPAARQSTLDLGIEFVYVPEGVYDRAGTRKNRVEARKVAELVFQHFEKHPDRSLGVVAFSEAQREAIDEELERMVRARPEFERFMHQRGLDAFFVKNLENVQGDERDVMFFSVGYGKGASGAMSLNMGPLNGDSGARRLNVAITRARYHVKLVSSIQPEDIKLEPANRSGVYYLREYLIYARAHGDSSSLPRAANAAAAAADSPFEDAVYRELTARGLTLHRRVGSSGYRLDLALPDPADAGHYLLGIECDGETYRSGKTARDRDRLRQQVLEGLDWRLLRIWSRDWVANPTAQVLRVFDALASLGRATPPLPSDDQPPVVGAGLKPAPAAPPRSTDVDEMPTPLEGAGLKPAPTIPPAGAPPSPRSPNAEPHPLTPDASSLPDGVTVYAETPLDRMGTPDNFMFASDAAIASQIVWLVEKEGPLAAENACRRIAACWGITRLIGSIEGRIRWVIRGLVAQGRVIVRDDFLWPIGMTTPPVRVPPDGEAPRSLEQIALEEIAEAAFICLQNEFSVTLADLALETARLLGYTRTSERMRERLTAAIGLLIADGRAREKNDKIELLR